MKLEIGSYVITSDERQFIVSKKDTVKESHFTKAENIGKDVLKPVGYYTTFNSALKSVPESVLKGNDDINNILSVLKIIDYDIKSVADSINVENIIVSKEEYSKLIMNDRKLRCLEDQGVKNWGGYEVADQLLKEGWNK